MSGGVCGTWWAHNGKALSRQHNACHILQSSWHFLLFLQKKKVTHTPMHGFPKISVWSNCSLLMLVDLSKKSSNEALIRSISITDILKCQNNTPSWFDFFYQMNVCMWQSKKNEQERKYWPVCDNSPNDFSSTITPEGHKKQITQPRRCIFEERIYHHDGGCLESNVRSAHRQRSNLSPRLCSQRDSKSLTCLRACAQCWTKLVNALFNFFLLSA